MPKGMIERTHPKLSVGAQCRLLSISRSSFYYEPQGETAMNLDLMLLVCVFHVMTGIDSTGSRAGLTGNQTA